MPFYQERIEFIPTANPDLVFCEYDKLRISFMVREGGRDENGQSLGPVKVVSISGKGYGSMLPTPDEIKGILNLFGLDLQRSRRSILPHRKDSRYGDILCYEQPMFLMPAQKDETKGKDTQTPAEPSGVVYCVRGNRRKTAAG